MDTSARQPQPRTDRCADCGSSDVYVTAILALTGSARLGYCREDAEKNDARHMFRVGSARLSSVAGKASEGSVTR